ncbi:synaptotagmin-4, partial [Acipenser oxyrinchus oxyrinchus]
VPYWDPEYPGQSLCQSVFIFCCKGMIEGIIVLLFIWLLILVLLNKHLEVHLQTLLGVGLAVLCFCLILGCILCWRRGRSRPCQDKASSSDHVSLDLGPAFSRKISPTSPIPIKQQYQELEGDVLEYPAQPPCSCSYPSPEHKFRPRSSSELDANYKTSYQQERQNNLSSYEKSPPFKPDCHGRASLPTIPKFKLVSKTKRALERRCTVTGAAFIYNEHSKLNSPGASEHSKLNSPGASEHSKLNSLGISEISGKVPPRIQFSLFFSPNDGSLTVSVLSLANVPRKIGVNGGCYVRLSLLPCCLEPLQTSVRRRSLSPEFREDFRFEVGAVEELRGCTLHMAVFSKDFPSLRASCLGVMLFPCGQVEWGTDQPTSYSQELSSTKTKLKKVHTPHPNTHTPSQYTHTSQYTHPIPVHTPHPSTHIPSLPITVHTPHPGTHPITPHIYTHTPSYPIPVHTLHPEHTLSQYTLPIPVHTPHHTPPQYTHPITPHPSTHTPSHPIPVHTPCYTPSEYTHPVTPHPSTHTPPHPSVHTPSQYTHPTPSQCTHSIPSQCTHSIPVHTPHSIPVHTPHPIPGHTLHPSTHTPLHPSAHTPSHPRAHTPSQYTHPTPSQCTHPIASQGTHPIPVHTPHSIPFQCTHPIPSQCTHSIPVHTSHSIPVHTLHPSTHTPLHPSAHTPSHPSTHTPSLCTLCYQFISGKFNSRRYIDTTK